MDGEPQEPFRKKQYQGKGHRGRETWEFIAWDGEGTAVEVPRKTSDFYITGDFDNKKGRETLFDYEAKPQPYVLLANSKTKPITSKEGLSSHDCVEYILNTKVQFPK